MGRRRLTPLLVIATLVAALIGTSTPAGATVPPGFVDELVATVGSPTALAFTPDGRLLITTQQGLVRVFSAGALLATPALNLGGTTGGANVLCSNSERGLLGITVDPQFASNGFVYLYYTFNKGDTACPTSNATKPVNRVSRFTMAGNTISFATELVLIDNIHSFAGNHNAGDVQFGKDGLLYISVGDSGCDYLAASQCAGSNSASRRQNNLLGKILRITKDGAIPAGNPFQGTGTARCNVTGSTAVGSKCQEQFAWGLRNPFRIPFDPNAAGTLFHINDVGQGTWEEIDLGTSGVDYGWNVCEGFKANGSTTTDCPLGSATDPLFAYVHDGCNSITGGAFVPTNAGWPAPYGGSYLFSDFVCGRIWRLVNQGGGVYTRADFATNLGGSSAVHMTFGPSTTGQALYYTTYASGGQVRRIRSTAGNTPPTAVLSADPTSGPAPLVVTLNGSGSFDPEGGALSYQWTFGDGQSQTTSTSSVQHTYNSTGTFTASLVVVDNQGAPSQADTEQIQVGNTPPSPTITSPANGALFTVGQTITLTGSATDPQQGTLPDSALTWTVLRHHDQHTHPWFGPTSGNTLTFQAPAPEDLSATTNSYLEVILTATDSGGLSATVTRDVMPKTVAITFATNPAGRTLVVNGVSIVGPTTITSWQGYVLNVSVPKQNPWKWTSWSDGGARNHSITTPATPTTYTATFTQGGGGGGCPPRC
jgi:glucose/arabinose dehydrogenase/PKD repeat protein